MGLKESSSAILRSQQDEKLKRFAVRVRLLPTITALEAPCPTYTSDTAKLDDAYAEGYNAAIYKMRELFKEAGFSA